MKDIKKFYFDVETTGLDWNTCAMHQMAFIVEINGEIVGEYDWKLRPHKGARIYDEALKVGGVTVDQIAEYEHPEKVYVNLLKELGEYVDKFDPTDKLHLVGFNNRYFDDRFLRAFFELHKDIYFGSWFWADSLDVMVLASQYMLNRRHQMKNFKLGTVAKTLGIAVQDSSLHDGLYDVKLTREVYNVITGNDLM